jgi:hypothetical protein
MADKKWGVGVALCHPEELSRSRSIMPTTQNNNNFKTKFWVQGWHGGTLKKYLG